MKQLPHAVRERHWYPQHVPQPWTPADTAVATYLMSPLYDPCGNYTHHVPAGVPEGPREPVVGCTWRGECGGLRLRDAGGEV